MTFVRHLVPAPPNAVYTVLFFACGSPIYIFTPYVGSVFSVHHSVRIERDLLLIQTYPLPECCQKERGQQSTTHILHSKRRRGAAETAENTQHPATLRQVPANTGQKIASTSSAGGTANQQRARVPDGGLQGIADAIAEAVKKSLRYTGLVLPQPVNQPHIQFIPDPPPIKRRVV